MKYATIGYLAALFCLVLAGQTYFFHLTEQISLSGFSVIEYLAHAQMPENFVRDFPGGSYVTTANALITTLYVPMQELTGLSGLSLLTGMIALEIATLLVGAWVFWRALLEKSTDVIAPADPLLRDWSFCLIATFVVSGLVLRANLSSFGYPYFHGQFYGFADACALFALAAFLRRRWALVALILCLGFAIHPIKTLMVSIFIAAAALVGGRETLNWRTLLTGFVTVIFAMVWGKYWLHLGQVPNAPRIPDDLFIGYTRLMQFHWYPHDNGVITYRQQDGLAPFLALMLLAMLSLAQSVRSAPLRRLMLAGFTALGIVTAAGIWIALYSSSGILVKLALVRASEPLVLFALFLLVLAIYHHARTGNRGWVVLYAGFLLAGMSNAAHMSLLIAVVAVALHLYRQQISGAVPGHSPPGWNRFLGIFAGSSLLLVTVLWLAYPESLSPFVMAVNGGSIMLGLALLLFGPLPRYLERRLGLPPQRWMTAVIGIWLFAVAAFSVVDRFYLPKEYLADGRAYYEAQRWAKANTSKTALFMVDPCTTYGWRDFSERSSLGTPHEWYMTGWLYVSDGRVFERGLAIGRALGLDLASRVPERQEAARIIYSEVCIAAQNLYYDPARVGLTRIVTQFGVDYFVMKKDKTEALQKAAVGVNPVFANDYYLIFAAKDLVSAKKGRGQ